MLQMFRAIVFFFLSSLRMKISIQVYRTVLCLSICFYSYETKTRAILIQFILNKMQNKTYSVRFRLEFLLLHFKWWLFMHAT